MSIITYPTDSEPLSASTTIWRYIDLTSLIVMLERARLHFPLMSRLGDPWEGAPSSADLLAIAREEGLTYDEAMDRLRAYQRRAGRDRNWLAASCWYMADDESAAMWDLYAAKGRGIALQTTVGALTESLAADREVWVGPVAYSDPLADDDPSPNQLDRAFRKRLAYRHEHELRLVTKLNQEEFDFIKYCRDTGGHKWLMALSGEGSAALLEMRDLRGPSPEGLALPIEPAEVIQRVVLAPDTRPWQADAVNALTAKFGLDRKAEYSALGATPLWRQFEFFALRQEDDAEEPNIRHLDRPESV